MSTRALLLALLSSGVLASEAADNWLAEDKAMHFAGGAAIGATTYALVQTISPNLKGWKKHAVAIGASAIVGIAKEIADKQDCEHHSCDARDAIATTAGGMLGSFSVSLVWKF